MISQLDDLFRFHQEALNLRAYRQQLIASNIANADTPNYPARDLDFAAALQGALGRQPENSGGVVRTSARHLPGGGPSPAAAAQVLYRTVNQPSVDGNTVDMDVERAQFADNAVHYEADLTIISGQIKMLLSAIQG